MASAQIRAFALIGDSNIHRHVNKTSSRAHPSLQTAQIIPCGHLGIFSESLQKLKPEVNVCVVACLTNFLSDADGPQTISHRIDPVLQQIRDMLLEFCTTNPARSYLISPPHVPVEPDLVPRGVAGGAHPVFPVDVF